MSVDTCHSSNKISTASEDAGGRKPHNLCSGRVTLHQEGGCTKDMHGACRAPVGLPKMKSILLWFLGTTGPPDDHLWLRKADLGRNWFWTAVNMRYPTSIIIPAEWILIVYWLVTDQPRRPNAVARGDMSACMYADWLSGPAMAWACFICGFLSSKAVEVMAIKHDDNCRNFCSICWRNCFKKVNANYKVGPIMVNQKFILNFWMQKIRDLWKHWATKAYFLESALFPFLHWDVFKVKNSTVFK